MEAIDGNTEMGNCITLRGAYSLSWYNGAYNMVALYDGWRHFFVSKFNILRCDSKSSIKSFSKKPEFSSAPFYIQRKSEIPLDFVSFEDFELDLMTFLKVIN